MFYYYHYLSINISFKRCVISYTSCHRCQRHHQQHPFQHSGQTLQTHLETVLPDATPAARQSHVCRVPLETVFNNETSHWRSPTKETLSNAWSLAWSPNRPIITSRCDSAQSDRECSALYGPRAPLEVKCQLFRLRRCTQLAKKSPNTVWQGIMATLA